MTSRAVVGSSAMRMSGFSASAMAIMMRWRWPPENWCGYLSSAALGVGDADAAIRSSARRGAAVAGDAVHAHHLGDLPADGVDRVQVASGSWKIIAMRLPLMAGARPAASAAGRAREEDLARGDLARRAVDQVHDRRGADALAGAALAEDGEGLAAVEVPADVVDRVDGAARVWNSTRGSGPRAGGAIVMIIPPRSPAASAGRVGGDAEPGGEEVERHRGDDDRQAGEEGDPPGGVQVGAALRDHQAPADVGRLDADAEEAQRGSASMT